MKRFTPPVCLVRIIQLIGTSRTTTTHLLDVLHDNTGASITAQEFMLLLLGQIIAKIESTQGVAARQVRQAKAVPQNIRILQLEAFARSVSLAKLKIRNAGGVDDVLTVGVMIRSWPVKLVGVEIMAI